MIQLLSINQAQKTVAESIRSRRISTGFTQQGLARRSGVNLHTLRKFEQTGQIGLTAFLKILMALGNLEKMVQALSHEQQEAFSSIDDVLKDKPQPARKTGWRN